MISRLASVPVDELTSEVAIAVVNDHLHAPDHVRPARPDVDLIRPCPGAEVRPPVGISRPGR